uniref:Uncharacterized protein n=1 Tax=Arundo donax TaxID=35708 RepID=A0A0A9BJU9_ARUDO
MGQRRCDPSYKAAKKKAEEKLIRDHFLPLPLPYNRKRLNAETSAMPTMLTLAAMAQATPPPACAQNRL